MAGFLDNCCPSLNVGSIADVDLHDLRNKGYQALMLDLDNTLLPWQSSDVPDTSREWVERAKTLGFKLCIVSNTHNPRRLERIAVDLGIESIARALKPRPYGFNKAAEMLGCESERAVVIGDQVLTDVLGGNRAGMYTVLVKPIHPREFFGTKISRVIEWFVLARLHKLGRLGTK